ncbi:MAG: energy transducer TonB [Pedobacter sp.]|nr:MAG: energy transducer TonB [Pedobacter sp.]
MFHVSHIECSQIQENYISRKVEFHRKFCKATKEYILFHRPTTTIFVLLFLSPKILTLFEGTEKEEEVVTQVEMAVAPPPPVNPETPPPPPVEPPPPKQDQVKFPPPIVKPDELVREEDPPTIEDLKKADPGQRTIEGDPDADIVITTAAGDGPKQAAVVEDTRVYDFVSLESQPSFPGGMEKFYEYLKKTVKYPAMAQENNIQGKVFLSFVVEKDGALTDIKVDRKLGGGTDEEAVRVLKASPRWVPGIQNGKKVRVKYNIPISFTLSQ